MVEARSQASAAAAALPSAITPLQTTGATGSCPGIVKRLT